MPVAIGCILWNYPEIFALSAVKAVYNAALIGDY